MKHIVFVVGNYKNGGVPMHATNLANEFAKMGHPTTILVTKEIGDKIFFEHHKNVNIISLKDYVSSHSGDKNVIKNKIKRKLRIRILKYLRYISKIFPIWDKKLTTEIKGLRHSENLATFIVNNKDSIYIPFGLPYFENVFYGAKGINCKIIYAERTSPEVEFPEDEFSRKNILKKLKRATKVVLQTQNSVDFYAPYDINPVLINNPLKPNLPEPYVGKRQKIVVTFCRVSTEKNLPLLINSFIEFHKRYPDYILKIYGNIVEKNEEELKDSLNVMITSLNADEFIKILPPRNDIHSVIRDCAMFVSTSNYEGLSNSMIEAMAIGMPCVCTDCTGGGAREMIKDGKNGLLTPINDISALAEAMKKMVEDTQFSQRCSKNAAKVRYELSAYKIAEKWINEILE